MSTTAFDLPHINAIAPLDNSVDVMKPYERSPEELSDIAEQANFDSARLEAIQDSEEGRLQLIQELEATHNGAAPEIVNELLLAHEEQEKEQTWLGKVAELPGKVLSSAKNFIGRHPILTGAVVITALGVAAYATGFGAGLIEPIQAWIATQSETAMGRIAGEIIEHAPTVVPGISPGTNPTDVLPPLM